MRRTARPGAVVPVRTRPARLRPHRPAAERPGTPPVAMMQSLTAISAVVATTPTSVAGFHPPMLGWIADGLVALAFVAVLGWIAVILLKQPDTVGQRRRAAILLAVVVTTGALAETASMALGFFDGGTVLVLVEAGLSVATLLFALLLWLFLPVLLAMPSPMHLVSVNARLAEEAQARRELVSELQRVNRDLEERVARRTEELREAKQRFELALSSSGITVFVQDAGLRYKWIHNPLLGRAPDEVIGRTDLEIMPASAANRIREVNRAVIADGEPREEDVLIPGREAGEDTFIRLHAAPERGGEGEIVGVICALVDITAEHRRTLQLEQVGDALAEANARFDQALAGSTITMFRQDPDLRYTWMYNPPVDLPLETFVGLTDEEALPEATRRVVVPAKRHVLSTGEPERIEVSMRIGEATRWFDLRIEPLLDDGGRVVGLTSVAIDISAQKEYHQQMRMVMRELTHRSKNLLAVVQGIARQTAQSVDGLPAFVERFGARLQALARAHDILVDESWRGAAIEELIATQLGHVIERSAERISAAGPKVLLKPEAAQNLALALHELSTNAAKYGALSGESGTVKVEWGPSEPDGEEEMFQIVWSEAGGPPAAPPERKGFGSVMIERLVPRAIDGTADLTYGEDGLTWRLVFPRRYLVEQPAQPVYA